MGRIKTVAVHNFRSLKDARLNFYPYTILIGANNAGKSNFLTALRIFYEDDIKFDAKTDFPKFHTDDDESWIEIEYLLTNDEFNTLKEEYKNPGNILRIRKYLKSEDKVKANQSNIYGYENGSLSRNLFYGYRNISQAKLGSLIYIPEVAKTEDTLKLSGPSPLRNLITFVMRKVIDTSESFKGLTEAFDEFNEKFRQEASNEGFSLNNLKKQINADLKEWGVEFNLDINAVEPDDIVKSLITHYAMDKILDKEVDVRNLGQGLQRHLIYTLLKLSSQYTDKKSSEKTDFALDLITILFEEPEAFLHPSQQESLNYSLKSLSSKEGQQVIISTHSPIFTSCNVEDIPSLIRLKRDQQGVTKGFQVSESAKDKIFKENNELAQLLKQKLVDAQVGEPVKAKIRGVLGNTDDAMRLEEESIRYLLWLDSERCKAFFADTVLICEGATEKVFIDYLLRNKWIDLREKKAYVLDSMGKFNIHRYMNLFENLGIYHSILADKDQDADVQLYLNQFIESQKNAYTKKISFFDKDVECFLGISPPPNNRNDKKPLNVMCCYFDGKISGDKVEALYDKVKQLI